MSPRNYRLGRREDAVRRTRAAILAAARDLLASAGSGGLSAGAVARQAGVSRITVYNQFGSRDGLLRELAAGARRDRSPAETHADARDELRHRIVDSSLMWASDPALFRGLPAMTTGQLESTGEDRSLAERLAATGQLRPGCSLKEAEDVIGAVTSFAVFDRLHRDGRRSTTAVADILLRMAAAILTA